MADSSVMFAPSTEAAPLAARTGREPLRVALFSGNYNYVMDGPARALNLLVGRLEQLGHQVLVFAPTADEPAFPPSGTLVSIPSAPLPGPRKEFRLGFGLPGAAKKRLDTFRPAIVHIATPDWLGIGALRFARRRGIPVVASFHTRFDSYPRFYGLPWLEKPVADYLRWFYGQCAHVYPPSQSMAEELRAAGIKDVRIWARGVDGDRFSPRRRSREWRAAQGFGPDDVVVAWVGRIVREKGLDMFADAFGEAAARNRRLKALIVGEGPERRRFETRLPTAVFLGHQDGEELARAYASADIFFNPSVTETFGQVTLEAMASGLACVCASALGSSSLVAHGSNGFLVPPAAGSAGYVERILELAEDHALRARCGQAARARAECYDWTTILDGLIANYRDAIATSRN